MTSKKLPAKFAKLELDIAAERGDFELFALFLREDMPDRWDVLISVPWASEDKAAALDYMVEKIKSDIGIDYLPQLSRIVFIDPSSFTLEELDQDAPVEHGMVEIRDTNIFGQDIKRGYIITCKQLSPVAA